MHRDFLCDEALYNRVYSDSNNIGGGMDDIDTGSREFAVQGSLSITVGGRSFGGAARIALLAEIAATGSISQAAKGLGMSYKGAWDAIDAMNNLAGEALVERVAGGKGGGGTRLTARGRQLVDNFHTIEQVHREFVDRLNRQTDAALADDFALVNRLNMKTSARNQFFGTVTGVVSGAVNDEIALDIAGGHTMVAIVTHESAQQLGLRPGAPVFALVQASSVILVEHDETVRFSARNRLYGTVARLTPGAVNAEVVVALPGGGTIAAIVTMDSVATLALAEGSPVGAMFKASSVILGVPA
jgi:molybdate transport system regulatory protein